jgi:hypothetical protein
MALIRMWRFNARQCFLVIHDRAYELRLIDDLVGMVRSERAASADAAVTLAKAWGQAETACPVAG